MKKSLALLGLALGLAACGAAEDGEGIGGPAPGNGGPGEVDPARWVGAPGVRIDEVSIYQGLKRTLMGPPSGQIQVPVVAGRDAIVRVFTTLEPDYNQGEVVARLHIDADEMFEVPVQRVPIRSSEGTLESTINFSVPGSAIDVGSEFRVELVQDREVVSGDNPSARYPSDGSMTPLDAQTGTKPLKIVLVPVVNGGRSPDVSDSQIALYERGFTDQFPTTSIELSVREAVSFEQQITPNGAGWSELLNGLSDLRARDGATRDTYYYGIFRPADSFGQFCSRGCISGLGFVARPTDSFSRVAIGLGFSGESSVGTAVHEIGHTHGREHAPCGVSDFDGAFPHAGARIGTWGLSPSSLRLFAPQQSTDFMSYCENSWVSDYTFNALYERMRTVDSQSASAKHNTFGRALVKPNGDIEILEPLTTPDSPQFTQMVRGADENGSLVSAAAHFVPFDHIDGGILLYPSDAALSRVISVEEGEFAP